MRFRLQHHHSGPNTAVEHVIDHDNTALQSSKALATTLRDKARSFGRCWSAVVSSLLLFPALALAQPPWERAASNLERSFTGPLARSLALVAIVIGGLMFMFGEGGSKRQIAGIAFGGGLALFATQFLAWLF